MTQGIKTLGEWEAKLAERCVEHPGGHIEWTGYIDRSGCGLTHPPRHLRALMGRTNVTITAALWACRYGSYPQGYLIPKCRKRWCVAPEHRCLADFSRNERGSRGATRASFIVEKSFIIQPMDRTSGTCGPEKVQAIEAIVTRKLNRVIEAELRRLGWAFISRDIKVTRAQRPSRQQGIR